ncbi:hypothetical protein VQ042_03750 [Aurantimonas sp. A2-1-M11]|uniref:hypothetical protein n=1 Tax=Aurantimonas sp. A2-1-M11 TaxID=3113712 RepID=UPI002F92768E
MLGVSAFPPGFGNDGYVMSAGPDAPSSHSRMDTAVPTSPAPAAVSQSDSEPTEAPMPIHYAPQSWARTEPPKQRIRLGRRGFYLSPSRREDLQGGAALADQRVGSIMIPTAVVGTLLAVASYFFDLFY